ncbi:Maspardin, partial [Bienertia sinuspersici]
MGSRIRRKGIYVGWGQIEKRKEIIIDLFRDKALGRELDWIDQKLRVCDICGAFLSVYNSDRRLADYFEGKLHLGYMQIREKLAELQSVTVDMKSSSNSWHAHFPLSHVYYSKLHRKSDNHCKLCSVSWAPSFLLKRYVLTGIRDGPHKPFIADSADFVVDQVESLSKDDLAFRLTSMVDSASVSPLLMSDASITIMDTNDYCAVPQQLKGEVGERYPGARQASLKSGVGEEPRPELVRGAPKPTNVGNPHEGRNREYDDPCSKDVAGSSNDPSNSQQRYNENDDHSQIQDEQEASNLLKPEKESCKGPLGGNEREDKDDPHGDDGGHFRGPAKSNEAENTGKLHQGVDESSRDSSKNEENKKADDAPRDLEGALIPFIFDDLKLSCSNERWPCNLAACLSIQDLQKSL